MTDSQDTPRRFRWGRILVGLAWAVLALTVLFSFALEVTMEQMSSFVHDAGVWSFVLFLALFSFVQPLGLSAHILILAAALLWPWWISIPLSLAGAVCSAITSYMLARYVIYDWVQEALSRQPKLKRLENLLVDRGLWGVIVFRVLTFTTPPAQLMMGAVRVRFGVMLLGTAIGFIPQICVDVFLGGELLKWVLE